MGLQECLLNLDSTRKELMPHGTLDFPCAGYFEERTRRPGDDIPWHWHDELEIFFVAAGSLRVQVPQAEYQLTAGSGTVFNTRVLHSAVADPWCQLHCIVFSPLLLTGSPDSIYAKKYLTPLAACPAFRAFPLDPAGQQPEIAAFQRAFAALAQDAPGFEFTVREELSRLCYALCQHFQDAIGSHAVPIRQDDVRIQKMLALIQEKYREPLPLPAIAKAADISERECLRCFKRTIRTSPAQYLLKYRLMRGAEALLQDPSGSIAAAASGCGFDSPSNFARMFRRYYACTPREYRQAAKAAAASGNELLPGQPGQHQLGTGF